MDNGKTTGSVRDTQLSDDDLEAIKVSLSGLRFGSVNISVQDGIIIQIERTEKHRIRRSPKLNSENA
jgi:Uncharacterized small protein